MSGIINTPRRQVENQKKRNRKRPQKKRNKYGVPRFCSGDISKSITFVSEDSADTYSQILEAIAANLQDLVGGMGSMTLVSSKPGKVKYEMQHQDGGNTYCFPVFFVKDDAGTWKIWKF